MNSNINLLTSRYTDPEGKDGICLMQLNNDRLIQTNAFFAGENPSYTVIGEDGYIYLANEVNNECRVSVCTIDNNGLKLKHHLTAPGSGVCHLSYDSKTGLLFASCYGSGHIHCFDTGTMSLKCSFLPEDSHNSHAHNTAVSNDGKWLFSTDLGKDIIYIFPMDEILQGKMIPVSCLELPENTGPRQIITLRDSRQLLCVNELDSSVMGLYFDDSAVKMSVTYKEVSTSHSNMKEQNYPGSATLSKSGKFLLVPNRGANTIAVFEVKDNELCWKYECDCHGDWPRYITLTEDGAYILVANQRSGNVVLYSYQEGAEVTLCYLNNIPVPDASCIVAL